MQDHDPRHRNKMIYAGHWSDYFSNLARNFAGSLVRLEGEVITQAGATEATSILTSIEYTPSRKHPRVTVTTKEHACSCEVNLVWSLEDEDGRVLGTEVMDPDDRKLNLYFET